MVVLVCQKGGHGFCHLFGTRPSARLALGHAQNTIHVKVERVNTLSGALWWKSALDLGLCAHYEAMLPARVRQLCKLPAGQKVISNGSENLDPRCVWRCSAQLTADGNRMVASSIQSFEKAPGRTLF